MALSAAASHRARLHFLAAAVWLLAAVPVVVGGRGLASQGSAPSSPNPSSPSSSGWLDWFKDRHPAWTPWGGQEASPAPSSGAPSPPAGHSPSPSAAHSPGLPPPSPKGAAHTSPTSWSAPAGWKAGRASYGKYLPLPHILQSCQPCCINAAGTLDRSRLRSLTCTSAHWLCDVLSMRQLPCYTGCLFCPTLLCLCAALDLLPSLPCLCAALNIITHPWPPHLTSSPLRCPPQRPSTRAAACTDPSTPTEARGSTLPLLATTWESEYTQRLVCQPS